MKWYSRIGAEEFIACSFVGILKSTLATHIVNKNCLELSIAVDNIFSSQLRPLRCLMITPLFTGVFVRLNNAEPTVSGVLLNSKCLVDNRILLIIRRHSQILSSGSQMRG
jgi:hypothetical protein